MRRALISIVLLGAALSVWPSGSSLASDSFTFYGSGFGHGLGMSQWGAYGLAQKGWSAPRILTHFYTGTKVERASPPAVIRVGLAQGRERVHLEARSGKVELRLGGPSKGEVVATIPGGETWTVRVADSAYRILDASGGRVGEPVGGTSTNLYAVYAPNRAMVRIPEAGHTYNRGSVEFNIYGCSEGVCQMRLVLSLAPQEYLYGLGEVPSEWPAEALKAQAIAGRTYAFARVKAAGQHRAGCNCAMYASSYDQVYAGYDKESGPAGERWVSAVDATADKVVTYGGGLIQAYYMASSGGHTENNELVWGGSPIPYLRGVCDPGDYTPANYAATWTVTFSADEVTRRLGLGIGRVTRFGDYERGVSGRIVSVSVTGESGSSRISGATLRARLGLRDDRVWINADRQIVGPIRSKYDGEACSPGLPISAQSGVSGGAKQAFEGGDIYYSQQTGAHLLTGSVLGYYLTRGGPKGPFGFPISDTRKLDSGGTEAAFQHGTIRCTADGVCSSS